MGRTYVPRGEGEVILSRTLARNIKFLRKREGIPQWKLAKILGFQGSSTDQSWVSQVETCSRGIEASLIARLSDYFDVNPASLVSDDLQDEEVVAVRAEQDDIQSDLVSDKNIDTSVDALITTVEAETLRRCIRMLEEKLAEITIRP